MLQGSHRLERRRLRILLRRATADDTTPRERPRRRSFTAEH